MSHLNKSDQQTIFILHKDNFEKMMVTLINAKNINKSMSPYVKKVIAKPVNWDFYFRLSSISIHKSNIEYYIKYVWQSGAKRVQKTRHRAQELTRKKVIISLETVPKPFPRLWVSSESQMEKSKSEPCH